MPFGKGGYSFARRPPSGGLFGSSVGIDMLRMVPKEERRRGWKELARIQRLNAQMARLIEDLLVAEAIRMGGDRLAVAGGRGTLRYGVRQRHHLRGRRHGRGRDRSAWRGKGDGDSSATSWETLWSSHRRTGPSRSLGPAPASTFKFAVWDTGPGIALEQLDHFFERSWQAEKTIQKGRGLGL
jgi:hypothetical protein